MPALAPARSTCAPRAPHPYGGALPCGRHCVARESIAQCQRHSQRLCDWPRGAHLHSALASPCPRCRGQPEAAAGSDVRRPCRPPQATTLGSTKRRCFSSSPGAALAGCQSMDGDAPKAHADEGGGQRAQEAGVQHKKPCLRERPAPATRGILGLRVLRRVWAPPRVCAVSCRTRGMPKRCPAGRQRRRRRRRGRARRLCLFQGIPGSAVCALRATSRYRSPAIRHRLDSIRRSPDIWLLCRQPCARDFAVRAFTGVELVFFATCFAGGGVRRRSAPIAAPQPAWSSSAQRTPWMCAITTPPSTSCARPCMMR